MKYVTDEAVRTTIHKWGGDVTRAAEELGIHRNNLYPRLERLGIDPKRLREQARATLRNSRTQVQPVQRNATALVREEAAQETTSATVTPAPSGRRFPVVQQAAAKSDAVDVPIRTVEPRRKPARLEPTNEARLVEFQRKIEAQYGVDTNLTALLNQFFEETFDRWAVNKLRPPEEKGGKK